MDPSDLGMQSLTASTAVMLAVTSGACPPSPDSPCQWVWVWCIDKHRQLNISWGNTHPITLLKQQITGRSQATRVVMISSAHAGTLGEVVRELGPRCAAPKNKCCSHGGRCRIIGSWFVGLSMTQRPLFSHDPFLKLYSVREAVCVC
jgi:hypothetical protein